MKNILYKVDFHIILCEYNLNLNVVFATDLKLFMAELVGQFERANIFSDVSDATLSRRFITPVCVCVYSDVKLIVIFYVPGTFTNRLSWAGASASVLTESFQVSSFLTNTAE